MENRLLLRELSIGQILDKALRIQRSHFWTLSAIVGAALAPMLVLKVISILMFNSTTIASLLQNLVNILVTLALVAQISKCYLEKPVSLGEAYGLGMGKFLSFFGASFLMGLAIGVPVAALLICTATMGDISLLGLALVLPVLIYLRTRWSLLSPSIILEDLGASEGLGRTWDLTKGYFWRVLATSFLASLMVLLITLLPTLFINYGLYAFVDSTQVIDVISETTTTLILTVAQPFSAAVTTVLYYDLRVRKEGYDLELMARPLPEPEAPED